MEIHFPFQQGIKLKYHLNESEFARRNNIINLKTPLICQHEEEFIRHIFSHFITYDF